MSPPLVGISYPNKISSFVIGNANFSSKNSFVKYFGGGAKLFGYYLESINERGPIDN